MFAFEKTQFRKAMSARCHSTGIGGALFPVGLGVQKIMEIPPKLKEYIDNNRSVYNRGSLSSITDPDEPLGVDSLGLIRIVAFLENELSYRIEDEELIADNFATVRQIAELLATKNPTLQQSGSSKVEEPINVAKS